MDDEAGPVPVPITSSSSHLLCDMVIPAIGQSPHSALFERSRGPKYYFRRRLRQTAAARL